MFDVISRKRIAVVIGLAALASFGANSAMSDPPPAPSGGPYSASAHGNATYGVSRNAMDAAGYTRGHCAHCHEQHASVGGLEPEPNTGTAMGAAGFLLFGANQIDQDENVCFSCHGSGVAVQTDGNVINRSYSYRAGKWTADPVDDVAESFAFGFAHGLDDISNFIDGKWGYTESSNPCAACHNPHAVQGDPANSDNGWKTSGSRGYMISRPSQHASGGPLWGDGAGEKMSDYPGLYQAPYRFGSTTVYEPDGSATIDGSNVTDYVTFCTDCHNTTYTIYSTARGRNLRSFDWSLEKHGGGNAENSGGRTEINAPYVETSLGQYALNCTDCHEPHGSTNNWTIRKAVNGGETNIPLGDVDRKWKTLCVRCHNAGSTSNNHHSALSGNCAIGCHWSEWDAGLGAFLTKYQYCTVCHYHSSTQYYDRSTSTNVTYNGGEHLF
ncbi:MAG: hypothetical protein C4519_05015 [Desulfobacteraceae bacterium]|nr:MAG: hypothetical protein C4519_05015 [Desulfobacteraceae bacterium]